MNAMNVLEGVERKLPTNKRGGRWIVLGAEEYQIPPLSFRSIQELKDDVEMLSSVVGVPTPEQRAAVARIIHASIARNYPELTLDNVEDMLDIGNMQTVLEAVMNVSGMTAKASPEGNVEVPSLSIGAESTLS